jgi:hypothetical protein
LTDDLYLGCCLVWIVVGLLAFGRAVSRAWAGAGLSLTFFLGMAINHFVGGMLFLLPWYAPRDRSMVEQGFAASTLGIAAFAVGCFGIAPALSRRFRSVPGAEATQSGNDAFKPLLVIGIGCYAGMFGLGQIPSLTSVFSVGMLYVLVALCLAICLAYRQGNRRRTYALLAAGLTLPLFTIVTQGFLGYGTGYALLILSFFVSLDRRPVRLLVLGLPLGLIALSFYVNYMRDRSAIRRVVWGGSGYEARIEQVESTLQSFEWFDPHKKEHLDRIDLRLNQNRLVGAAIAYVPSHRDLATGETLWMALLAVVPRAVWPDKPVQAGSMDLVSQYTGIHFSRGTSVGMGMIFEFYVNFGLPGIFWGLLLIGVAVGVADQRAGAALRAGLPLEFGRWLVVGIILANVLGSLAEITASLAAAALLHLAIKRLVVPRTAPGGADSNDSPHGRMLIPGSSFPNRIFRDRT